MQRRLAAQQVTQGIDQRLVSHPAVADPHLAKVERGSATAMREAIQWEMLVVARGLPALYQRLTLLIDLRHQYRHQLMGGRLPLPKSALSGR